LSVAGFNTECKLNFYAPLLWNCSLTHFQRVGQKAELKLKEKTLFFVNRSDLFEKINLLNQATKRMYHEKA